jgi:hypothetical protein
MCSGQRQWWTSRHAHAAKRALTKCTPSALKAAQHFALLSILQHQAGLVLTFCPVNCVQRTSNGRKYYDFEFTAKSSVYTRHALASVTVGNGDLQHCMALVAHRLCKDQSAASWPAGGRCFLALRD